MRRLVRSGGRRMAASQFLNRLRASTSRLKSSLKSLWGKHRYEIVRDLTVSLLAVVVAFQFDSSLAERQERSEDRRAEQQERLEDRRAHQQEVLENLRFVRERSSDPDQTKPFTFMELSGANLSNLDLGCEDRALSISTCASLNDANLDNALLVSTALSGAIMSDANLVGADLTEAVVIDAYLDGADASGATFFNAFLTGTSFYYTNLRGANLTYATADGALFVGADMVGANLAGAILTDAMLTGSNLTDANLVAADLTGVVLSGQTADGGTGEDLDVPILDNVCYDERTLWPAGFTPPPMTRDCTKEKQLPAHPDQHYE